MAQKTKAGDKPPVTKDAPPRPREIGGPPGPEPTRYKDWEKNGIASDF
ncbi:MAG: succinate dehydrogenase assembly factor 4 [Pseudomonadota bacterium]